MQQSDKRRGLLGIAVGVSLLAGLVLHEFGVPTHAERRIEYRVMEVSPDTGSMERALNDQPVAGWELVAVTMGDLQAPRLIFKR